MYNSSTTSFTHSPRKERSNNNKGKDNNNNNDNDNMGYIICMHKLFGGRGGEGIIGKADR